MLFDGSFSSKKEPLLTENCLPKNLAATPPFTKSLPRNPGIIALSRAKFVFFALNDVLNGTNKNEPKRAKIIKRA